MTNSIAAKLARIAAKNSPRLTHDEIAVWDKINHRLARTAADLRRATKRGDAKQIATAERARARAEAARDAFVAPRVSGLGDLPKRILYRTAQPWSGPSGHGVHHHEVEMVFDYADISGPHYRTVRVLKDEGGPPTGARGACTGFGIAWFAIGEFATSSDYTILPEVES